MVLVPEVVDAVGDPMPVLAAGGIVTGRQMAAAVALGAAGRVDRIRVAHHGGGGDRPDTQAEDLAAASRDTCGRVPHRKAGASTESDWTDAWDADHAPEPLPMPLQSMISEPALRRIDTLAANGDEGARAGHLLGGPRRRPDELRQTRPAGGLRVRPGLPGGGRAVMRHSRQQLSICVSPDECGDSLGGRASPRYARRPPPSAAMHHRGVIATAS